MFYHHNSNTRPTSPPRQILDNLRHVQIESNSLVPAKKDAAAPLCSELEAKLMDYVNLRSAAVLTAIKSDYSDSSKKFPALVDLMMIPSEPQRIIAARASVVSSR